MAFLTEITQYKNTVMRRLTEDRQLCKALFYSQPDFLEQPDLADRSILAYNHIYPYPFLPDEQSDAKTLITMSFNKCELVNNAFKKGEICLNVMTHQSLFETAYEGTRVDFLLERIDALLNARAGIGIGKLAFQSLNEFTANPRFMGSSISYKPIDFNGMRHDRD